MGVQRGRENNLFRQFTDLIKSIYWLEWFQYVFCLSSFDSMGIVEKTA